MSDSAPTRILFVCLGNICRSPLAEGVFRHHLAKRGILDRFDIDSAGTGGWHAGEPADPRARAIAEEHGVTLTSRARKVTRNDFDRFDWLICMDQSNADTLLAEGAPPEKVQLLLSYDDTVKLLEVPDPYYGGDDGFRTVFRLVDSACQALMESLLNTRSAS